MSKIMLNDKMRSNLFAGERSNKWSESFKTFVWKILIEKFLLEWNKNIAST